MKENIKKSFISCVLLALMLPMVFYNPSAVSKKCNHKYVTVSTKKSTCTKNGYKKYKCKKCKKYKTVKLKKNHSYKLKKKVRSTYTKNGYKQYKCKKCGTTKKVTLKKLRHSYKFIKTVKPTCTKNGYELYKCKGCGKTKKETIKKLGHNHKYIETVNSTCETVGYKLYDCTRCDSVKKSTLKASEHNYELIEKVNSTCTTEGLENYKCSKCDKIKKTTLKVLDHEYKVIETVDSTCTKTGLIKYACECGKTSEKTIEQKDHNFVTTKHMGYSKKSCVCGEEQIIYDGNKEYTIDLGNGQTTTVVGHYDNEIAEDIVDLVNEYREDKGLKALDNASNKIQKVADIRAYEIVINDSLSHYRPNGERALISFHEYSGCRAENLARFFKGSGDVVEGWKNSAGHNKNLLSEKSKAVSVSVFKEQVITNGKVTYKNHYAQIFE